MDASRERAESIRAQEMSEHRRLEQHRKQNADSVAEARANHASQKPVSSEVAEPEARRGDQPAEAGFVRSEAQASVLVADHVAQARETEQVVRAQEALVGHIREIPESVKTEWVKKQLSESPLPADYMAKLRGTNELPRASDFAEMKTEQQRFQESLDMLKEMKELDKTVWEKSDVTDRRVALERVGRALGKGYECPDPPLMDKHFPEYKDGTLYGFYTDENYEVVLNEKLMLHDNPRVALDTFCHEYRHAYQTEMAQRHERFPHLAHDPEKAAIWAENFRNYRAAEDGFSEYRRQPVEQDAREFAQRVLDALYEDRRSG